jgi:hypothetical protein
MKETPGIYTIRNQDRLNINVITVIYKTIDNISIINSKFKI